MKWILVAVLLVSLTQASWVQGLTQEEFSEVVQPSRSIWFISQGEEQPDVLEKVGELVRGIFKVGFLPKEGQTKLSLYGDDKENPVTYDGAVDAHEIVQFILSHTDEVIEERGKVAKALKANQEFQEKEKERLKAEWDAEMALREKSDTILLNFKNWDSFLQSRQAYLINFYEANCSECQQLNKEWEKISTEMKGRIKIAKINMTEQGNHVLEESIQIKNYPSVRFYASGPKKTEDFTHYKGVMKKFTLTEWINERLNEKSFNVQIPELTQQNYETLCKKTKNTCIIIFLDGSEPQQTLKQIQGLSLKHLKKPISFLIANKGKQDKFAEQVGVSSYPDTVLMYCKMKKMWRMEELNFQSIDETIGEISLGNRNGFSRYNFQEELQ